MSMGTPIQMQKHSSYEIGTRYAILQKQWRRKRSGRSGHGRYTFLAKGKKSIADERLQRMKPRLHQ